MLTLEPLTSSATPAIDRRIARRARPAYNTVFRFQGENARRVCGLVWDISVSGLGLLLPFAPTPGTTFEGELRTEDDRPGLPTSFTVAHVRRLATGDYFVGGKLAHPLSESDLGRFVLPTRDQQPRPARTPGNADAQPVGRWRKDRA